MTADLRVAVRQLVRQPALSVAAVATLGLGLAAALAVITILNAVLLRPLPYPEPDRIMAVGRGIVTPVNQQNGSHRDVAFLREHVRSCSPIAATVAGSGLNVELNGTTNYSDDRLVSHQYFDVWGVQPTWGRAFTSAEDVDIPPPVVVLNERFVRRLALDPAQIVGADIQVAGRAHTVVGVLGARHTRPFDPDIYRPLGRDSRGGGQNLDIACRLVAGATPGALAAEFAALRDEARRARLIGDAELTAYSAVSRHEWEFGAFRPQINTLLLAVALVLLVAAANTTGLLLVRAAGRRREMAVRTALGASPRRIARAVIVEGLTLAATAASVGLAVAPLMVNGLLAAAPAFYGELARFTIDRTVVAIAAALCVAVALFVSTPPLLELLRVNLRDTLQEESRGSTAGRRSAWMRQALIGAETAICAVLLVGALLLLRTFASLMAVDTGVDSRNVLTARISIQGERYAESDALIRFFEQGLERLQQSPAIEVAAVGASLPAERALNLASTFPDASDPERVRVVNWRYVSPSYFTALRMRTIAGRALTETDGMGTAPVMVVNETVAKEVLGGIQQALGRRIAINRQAPREIVGVVSDTSGWSLRERARPMTFVPLAQVESANIRIAHSFFPPRFVVRARDVEGARLALESVVRDIDPSQPFIEIQTLDALMVNSVAMQRFYLVVLSAFAVFALLLAAVGIYASYSYAVTTRAAEIGVRLALGARPAAILGDVVGRALLVGGVATAVGLVAAVGATRLLRSVLFDVKETDPLTYLMAAAVLLLTVAGATLVPALRAARTDPLSAMRG